MPLYGASLAAFDLSWSFVGGNLRRVEREATSGQNAVTWVAIDERARALGTKVELDASDRTEESQNEEASKDTFDTLHINARAHYLTA